MTDDTKDINDIFDDIVFSEERLIEQGYDEGLKAGIAEGSVEGLHLGYHRGAEVGAELGFYLGVVSVYLSAEEKNPGLYSEKIFKQLKRIKELIDGFPRTNSQEADIVGSLEQIRAIYKRVCSLLKLDAIYQTGPAISF